MHSQAVSIGEFQAVGGWDQVFAWALDRYGDVIRLGHYGQAYPYGTFPNMLAAGARDKHACRLDEVAQARLHLAPGHWWLGYIAYEAGRAFHDYPDLGLPRLDGGFAWEFISPDVQWIESDGQILLHAQDPAAIWQDMVEFKSPDQNSALHSGGLCEWLTKPQYIEKINSIKGLLHKGELYEMNFCRPVEVPGHQDMPALFRRLAAASPMPFQFYVRTESLEMAGSSPERFLKKMGGHLISQPIKGTAPRGANPEEDNRQRHWLRIDEKIIAENMMITDLVRNDLMRLCRPGSVQVDEVFGVYTFRNLHQLITTVSGQLPDEAGLWQILAATFPMGSMTGAPKTASLRYIEEHEAMARGPFSGAMGWVAPNGDFDFSVIIRSLYQNRETNRCWLNTGGAIVWDSDPQAEFEEAHLKASALLSVVNRGEGSA
jgi:para-aminobenzoate synthetase component 1